MKVRFKENYSSFLAEQVKSVNDKYGAKVIALGVAEEVGAETRVSREIVNNAEKFSTSAVVIKKKSLKPKQKKNTP